jgi:hypothetical protein
MNRQRLLNMRNDKIIISRLCSGSICSIVFRGQLLEAENGGYVGFSFGFGEVGPVYD